MAEDTVKGQVYTSLGKLKASVIFGYCCMMIALMTPATLLLTFKILEITSSQTASTAAFGLVTGVGAFFALIGNPIGGALSDRTNIRFGRRRTWIILGPLVGCTALVFIGFSSEVWQVVVLWSVVQLFFNFGMAAYTALVPDQVPVEKQGSVSGLIGIAIPVAIAIGMVLMNVLPATTTTPMKWIIISFIGIIGPIISTFFIKDGKVDIVRHKDNTPVREKLKNIYPSPRKYPEFTWAMIGKFLLMMGYCSSVYFTMMLVQRMGMTESQATGTVATVNIITMVAAAIMSIFGGILSDKVGKQKPFLYVSGAVMALGVLTFAFFENVNIYIIASAIIGLGFGCFSAVDTALVSRILPSKENAAKDLGFMNVANALPQSIVPAVAPFLLGVGGWEGFYITLGICALLGVVAIRPLPERKNSKNITNPATDEKGPFHTVS
ncbi:MFS transporter [Paenibacillus sp. Marseille-Q4541]|uniref:MFS transporter n=1 Tax=Paenibacillus sp. Marseille-Q4541 TaxID=2831522 RepID=UPI001BAD8377|nr:MFS transporter [Paenibacillus sp. Marseille-Q4541]